jgi:predicted aldo/keto reductase-like oxidoreductase
MKSLGDGRSIGQASVEALRRYAMSQPVSTVVTGCESMEELEQAIEVGGRFEPMSDEEQRELESRLAASGARDGRFEAYKTTTAHDATTYHPQWLA